MYVKCFSIIQKKGACLNPFVTCSNNKEFLPVTSAGGVGGVAPALKINPFRFDAQGQ